MKQRGGNNTKYGGAVVCALVASRGRRVLVFDEAFAARLGALVTRAATPRHAGVTRRARQ